MKEKANLLVFRQKLVHRQAESLRQQEPVEGLAVDKITINATLMDLLNAGPESHSTEQGEIPVMAGSERPF
jgi:hypothetical protein